MNTQQDLGFSLEWFNFHISFSRGSNLGSLTDWHCSNYVSRSEGKINQDSIYDKYKNSNL